MNKIFFFYPHCYLKSTNREILVYDTINRKYVYTKKNPLSPSEKVFFQKGFVYVSETPSDFVNQCIMNGLGYYVDFESISPFMYNRDLEFVTSLSKEKKALGYNLHSYTNLLLKEVTVLLNNHKRNYHRDICLQMGFPQYNDAIIDLDYIFRQLSSFPHIESIILSGELDKSLLSALEYAKERDIHITHRILLDSTNDVESLHCMEEYENFSIELLVDSSMDVEQIKSLVRDKIYVKAIIQSIHEIEKFQNINNVIYLPVLSPSHNNMDILNQMILSEDEILQSPKSLKDCLMSDYTNPLSYGNLVIDYDGSVSCLGEIIASIYDTDLSSIVNAWVSKNNNMWYYTRQKKKSCKDCALQALCPPISIYEKLGYYECPCKI